MEQHCIRDYKKRRFATPPLLLLIAKPSSSHDFYSTAPSILPGREDELHRLPEDWSPLLRPFSACKFFVFALLLSLFPLQKARAQQTGLDQSSPGLDWQVIGNDFVDVIYPAEAKAQAVYMANLFEHYSQVVGVSYGIEKPKKITLVYRIERAEPNGFVTLAPRRTEFYSSSTFSPIIGSLDWTQILSIHEYRHVNQFDYFNRNTVRFFDYAMGGVGILLAHFFSLHSWYMEGDAVWSETKYTDGGRGRSPRFMARLKAILLKGEIPTYDQFVNGTYRDALVNQYVYGFILIANGYKKFGADFWPKVVEKTTVFPHPYRFSSSFQAVSGQSFAAFYQETFEELRKSFQNDAFPELKETGLRERFHVGSGRG